MQYTADIKDDWDTHDKLNANYVQIIIYINNYIII